MADNAFGDDMFDVFERDDDATDTVMMSKISKDMSPQLKSHKGFQSKSTSVKNDSENGKVEVVSVSDDTSSNGEIETERAEESTDAIEIELMQLKKENILFSNSLRTE